MIPWCEKQTVTVVFTENGTMASLWTFDIRCVSLEIQHFPEDGLKR